jgi:hypothetical protein
MMATAKDTENFKKTINWWFRKNIHIALYSVGLLGAVLFDSTVAALWKMLGTEIDWFPVTKLVLGFINNIDDTISDHIEAQQEELEHQ